MIEGQWFEVSYAQFARFLGFRRTDADHLRIHMALKLEARKKVYVSKEQKWKLW
jgi:hypothetical protein